LSMQDCLYLRGAEKVGTGPGFPAEKRGPSPVSPLVRPYDCPTTTSLTSTIGWMSV
jgi:hypothetical protein